MDSNDNDNVILYDIVEYLNWLNSNKESNLALSNENQSNLIGKSLNELS